jgi:hypothetical protein
VVKLRNLSDVWSIFQRGLANSEALQRDIVQASRKKSTEEAPVLAPVRAMGEN